MRNLIEYILLAAVLFAVLVLGGLSCFGATIIPVARYRIDESERTIARLALDVACGVLESREKTELLSLLKNKAVWFPDGEVEREDIAGALALVKQLRALADKYKSANVQVWLDGEPLKLDAEALRPLLKRLAGFVADTDSAGSVEYRYTLTVQGWPVERWCRITDGRVETTATIRAVVHSQVDWPAVRTTTNYVQLRELATESDSGTSYRSECHTSSVQSYHAGCRLIRRMSAKQGPGMTKLVLAGVIDGLLATYTGKIRDLADAGETRGDRIMVWVGVLRTLHGKVFR